MDREDQANAEDSGELVAVCHSHPYKEPFPTDGDRVECERSGVPWIIVNYPVGTYYEWEPDGYRAPLIGRDFLHGVLDCYTLIRDYYEWELGIALPEFERPDEWWKLDNYDLYKDNFEKAGFRVIAMEELQPGDVILMQIASRKINHGAIYLGDQIILHHLTNQLSAREVYGGQYLKHTTHYLRHHGRDIPNDQQG
jgi:hypothetical protein